VVYLSDWLEHDQATLTLWHGGMAPFQLRFISLAPSVQEGKDQCECSSFVSGFYQKYQNGAVNNQLTDLGKGGGGVELEMTVNLLMCGMEGVYSVLC
jgi:hypothetical protein